VINAKCRPTAREALKHVWLNGGACKHLQLQVAPQRLKQLVNGRKLKVQYAYTFPLIVHFVKQEAQLYGASRGHLCDSSAFLFYSCK